MNNIYYVYAYLREDGTPYYIGKGKNRRAWNHHKTEQFKTPTDVTRITIIKELLTESDAFVLERELILRYGRKDLGTEILQNRTNGGEGPSGVIRTEEQKQLQRKPKPPGHGAKVSKALTGRKQTEEHKAKYKNRIPHNKGIKGVVSFKQKTLVCPHCSKSGGATAMRKWHFDKCKLLPSL
jgi:hypothetical protein